MWDSRIITYHHAPQMTAHCIPPNVKNSWIKLTLENRLARGECPRTYKHMVKLIFNPYGTLGS